MYSLFDWLKPLILISITVVALVFATNLEELLCCFTDYQSAEEIAIENEYTAYFDGQEIDINKIDLSQYEVTVNHEKEEVYITYKQKSSSSMYPIFIPYKY